MSCEQTVINGCNGKCCENFSFPFSPDELQQMVEIIQSGEDVNEFFNSYGKKIRVMRDPEIEKIQEMIIYLGPSQIDPQEPYATIGERYRFQNYIPEDYPITMPENIKPHMQKFWQWMFIKDNEIWGHTYTCKHFDTEKKICNNYEDRPNMCKSYGRGCKYQGCGFETIRKMEEDKYWSDLAKTNQELTGIEESFDDQASDEIQ